MQNTEGFPPVPWISQNRHQLRIPVKDPDSRFRYSCFYAANANTEELSWKNHCSLCACRETALNMRLVAATTNRFIFSNNRFTNEILGYAWPVLIVIIDDGILSSKYGIDRSPRYNNLNERKTKTISHNGKFRGDISCGRIHLTPVLEEALPSNEPSKFRMWWRRVTSLCLPTTQRSLERGQVCCWCRVSPVGSESTRRLIKRLRSHL